MFSMAVDVLKRLFSGGKQPNHSGANAPRRRHPRIERILRRLQAGFVLGLGAGLIVVGMIVAGTLKPFESRLGDLFYHARPPSDRVILISVDDKTVDQYGWPIERITHGALLAALIRSQARVVAFDFILPDPTAEAEDFYFAAIIRRTERIIQPVLGIEATRFPPSPGQFPAFDSLLRPAPALRTPNSTFAHTMIYPDSDGIVRRVPLAIDVPGQRFPGLGLVALALSSGQEPIFELKNNQVRLGDTRIPVNENGELLINFFRHNSPQVMSYADVTQGRADYSLLRDKIVLVGPMTAAVPESYAVPIGVGDARTFNIEIQADVIETILSGDFLNEEDLPRQIETVLLIALLAGATLTQFRAWRSALVLLGYFALLLLFAFAEFDHGIVPKPLGPMLVLILTFVLAMLYRYISEERTRAMIGRIFLGSVSPESMSQVLAGYDRGTFSLQGGLREVTVLCANLRGLSSLSEGMAPQAVLEFLNQQTASILEIVFRNGGSIHSQTGNTIFAMWNLPLEQPDHARRAVSAAFEIQRNAPRRHVDPSGGQMLELDLGVATGGAITGPLHASERAQYSVIGDVVNLAERLSILASENQVYVDTLTRDLVDDTYESNLVHSLRLRGKKDPVQVWQLRPKSTLDVVLPT